MGGRRGAAFLLSGRILDPSGGAAYIARHEEDDLRIDRSPPPPRHQGTGLTSSFPVPPEFRPAARSSSQNRAVGLAPVVV